MTESVLTEAEREYTAGKYQEAAEKYRAVIAAEPGNALAHQGLAQCLNRLDQLEEAAQVCETALQIDPELATPYAVLGHIYFQQHQLEESAEALEKAIELNPALEEAYVSMGATLIKQGKHRDAMSVLQKALELNPKRGLTHRNLSLAYSETKRYSKAVVEAWHGFRLEPSLRTCEFLLFALHRQMWKYRLLCSLLIVASLLIPAIVPSALIFPFFALALGYLLWNASLNLRSGRRTQGMTLLVVVIILAVLYVLHITIGL